MSREPTLMQQRMFAEMQNPKNKTVRQAATAAGFSPGTPTKAIMARLNETTLADALVERGMTANVMADRIMDGQDALKMQLDSDGGEHFSPDWPSRHRYNLLVLRMFGIRTTGAAPPSEAPVVQINTFNRVYQLMGESLAAQRNAQTAEVVEIADA